MELHGEHAPADVEAIKSLFEPNMEPGMRKIARMMEGANAGPDTTGSFLEDPSSLGSTGR